MIPGMDAGELLTRWTVRGAVACYLAGVLLRLTARQRADYLKFARNCWTLGYVVFLIHIVCAFQFYHHWSHTSAYEETAKQTRDVIGVAVGIGVYVNYFFMLVWAADVASWWGLGIAGYEQRPWWLNAAVQAFLAFIFFNGTVVFEPGFSRWLGILGCLVVAAALLANRRRSQKIESTL